MIETTELISHSSSVEEKREKIRANYETIEVLRQRLEKIQERERVGMTRAAYVKMIYDVTKKVDKQNDELAKAIVDTRYLQRDIGNLCGRLERSFKVVEEAILKNSNNDGWSSECYKLLTKMHGTCDQLIQAVQETGELSREIRQLEDQIGRLKLRSAIETTTTSAHD